MTAYAARDDGALDEVKETLDFIVIGAQKAGTTSLFEYLRGHPEICLPAAKEAPYFSHDANYSRDWGEYLRKAFPFAERSCKWGTVTPHYMVGGVYDRVRFDSTGAGDERTVPSRIYSRLPDVRLIAIVRDPVERARSHHAMATMNGWEDRSFAQAIGDLLRPDALARARGLPEETTGYVVWGEYGRILAGYFDVFPRGQLLVLYSDDLKEDPAGVLRRIFAFLGVGADFVPDNLGRMYRTRGDARRLGWLNLNSVQQALAANTLTRGGWHALPDRTRRRIDMGFKRMKYLADLWNRRTIQATASSEEETLSALRHHYGEDGERLVALLAERPPWAAVEPASRSG